MGFSDGARPIQPAVAPLTSEHDLLLLTASDALDAAGRARLRAALADDTDWGTVIQAALAHGTAGLLCQHLLALPPADLPPALRHAAADFIDRQAQAAQAARADLFRVLDALAAQDIPAIPFKGAVIALQAHGRGDLRGHRDIDVLIREADVWPAMRVLAGLGYRSQIAFPRVRQLQAYYDYNGQDMLFAEDRVPLEPHWAFAPRTFGARLGMEGVWARATRIAIAGRTVACLSPEDTFIAAALHGCKERWSRLIWIADIAGLLRRHPALDWTAMLARARAAGLLRMVLLAATLAEQVLQAPLPAPVASAARADRTCRRLAAEVARDLARNPRERSVFALSRFQWRVRDRLADRLRYAFASATTARVQHLRMIDLPDSLAFAYPAVKLVHDYLALPVWLAGKALVSARRAHGR